MGSPLSAIKRLWASSSRWARIGLAAGATFALGAFVWLIEGLAGTSFSYDLRQNLTGDGARSYTYDIQNRLTAVTGASSMTLAYDPLGRLRQTTSGGSTTELRYDGDRLIAEYDGAGAMASRHVHGEPSLTSVSNQAGQ